MKLHRRTPTPQPELQALAQQAEHQRAFAHEFRRRLTIARHILNNHGLTDEYQRAVHKPATSEPPGYTTNRT